MKFFAWWFTSLSHDIFKFIFKSLNRLRSFHISETLHLDTTPSINLSDIRGIMLRQHLRLISHCYQLWARRIFVLNKKLFRPHYHHNMRNPEYRRGNDALNVDPEYLSSKPGPLKVVNIGSYDREVHKS